MGLKMLILRSLALMVVQRHSAASKSTSPLSTGQQAFFVLAPIPIRIRPPNTSTQASSLRVSIGHDGIGMTSGLINGESTRGGLGMVGGSGVGGLGTCVGGFGTVGGGLGAYGGGFKVGGLGLCSGCFRSVCGGLGMYGGDFTIGVLGLCDGCLGMIGGTGGGGLTTTGGFGGCLGWYGQCGYAREVISNVSKWRRRIRT
ncbi:hypothetical protein OROGR_000078 [Orobanche gracilis]